MNVRLTILLILTLAASHEAAEATVENAEVPAWSPLPRMLPVIQQVQPVSFLSGINFPIDEQRQDETEQEGHLDERRFHPGKAAYLSAGLALSSGVLAWLSKREADEAYDHYLRAAGSERQKTQFDRAERYDRLSGAAFAAMEAGIVMTAYFTFF